MSLNKTSFQDSIEKKVITTRRCVGCGACVISCPYECLEYVNEKPNLISQCKICGVCQQACPKHDWPISEAERFIFGRKRRPNEAFGIYRRLIIAQAEDKRILSTCQDGGVATALLMFALENRTIDGAIVSTTKKEKPFAPIPRLATTPQEILESAGTRYSYSPSITTLVDIEKKKRKNLAFVGTPCQINAIRRMQMSNLRKYTANLRLLIGLMCSECFTHEGLMEKHIQHDLGIKLDTIRKMNIKGKILITTDSGVRAIPLSEAKPYIRAGCKLCEDYSSELADISLGGLRLNGWTLAVIRSEVGERSFSQAEEAGRLKTRPVEDDEPALSLLSRLSETKRARHHTA
jgi:coenzyme F420 hydrogenase subunit beta